MPEKAAHEVRGFFTFTSYLYRYSARVMTYRTFRTSNTQSLRFRAKRYMRRTRTRVLESLIQMLDGDTRLAA